MSADFDPKGAVGAPPGAPPRAPGGPQAGPHAGPPAGPSAGPSATGRGGAGPFGCRSATHCLVQRFRGGRWEEPALEPVHRLDLAPQTRAMHYAQSVFEGFKAHRQADGGVALFRPQAHLTRLNRSAARMCLPPVDPEQTLSWVRALVARDRDEVPDPPESLYVRPLLFADDEDLVAGPGDNATLFVLLSPVPAFFGDSRGLNLRTETRFVRAFPGGTGAVKAAGNYAAAMLAQRAAREEGFHEVVWLDAATRSTLEETGAMNLFVVRKGEILTPPAGDTVLPGITRDSLLRLAADHALVAREERIPLDHGFWDGVSEVFSSGTAVGCTPIASILHEGRTLFAHEGSGRVQRLLSGALMDVKEGRAADPHGWRVAC